MRINKLLAEVTERDARRRIGQKGKAVELLLHDVCEIGWLACTDTTRGNENMRLSECGTRSKKGPRGGRRLPARGGCS